jgi:hypothetical protein
MGRHCRRQRVGLRSGPSRRRAVLRPVGRLRGGGRLKRGGARRWSAGGFGFGFGAINHFAKETFLSFFSFDASRRVKDLGLTIIAVFLEGKEFLVDAAEQIDGRLEFGEFAFEILTGSRLAEEQLRKPDGGRLKADLGQVRGVFVAMMLQEVVLTKAGLEGSLTEDAPLGVTAVGDPVGDVTLGDLEAELVEGFEDSFIGNAAVDHTANHVAFVLGERSDGAGARAALEDGRGRGGTGAVGEAGRRERSLGSRSGRCGDGQGDGTRVAVASVVEVGELRFDALV